MSRCYTKSRNDYHLYGGRGILVADEWHDIKIFMADMSQTHKKGLQIDRIDNDKGYSKENCRWATPYEQGQNKRNNVKFIGETASDASKRLGGCKQLVTARLKRGWSIKYAFTKEI